MCFTSNNFKDILNAFPLGKNTEHPSEKKVKIHLSGETYVIDNDSNWNTNRAQGHIDKLFQEGISGNIIETYKGTEVNGNILFQMKIKGIEYNYIVCICFNPVTNSFNDNIYINIVREHEEIYAVINYDDPDNSVMIKSELIFDVELPTSEYNIQFDVDNIYSIELLENLFRQLEKQTLSEGPINNIISFLGNYAPIIIQTNNK